MKTQDNSFKIIHPNAAGIDVGSRSHMVAVDQSKENVREFGIYTKDHEELITYLYAQGIITIASSVFSKIPIFSNIFLRKKRTIVTK